MVRPPQQLADLLLELAPERGVAAHAAAHELVYAVRLSVSLQHPSVVVYGAVLVHHSGDAKVVLQTSTTQDTRQGRIVNMSLSVEELCCTAKTPTRQGTQHGRICNVLLFAELCCMATHADSTTQPRCEGCAANVENTRHPARKIWQRLYKRSCPAPSKTSTTQDPPARKIGNTWSLEKLCCIVKDVDNTRHSSKGELATRFGLWRSYIRHVDHTKTPAWKNWQQQLLFVEAAF